MASFGRPTSVSEETAQDCGSVADADELPPKAIMIGHYTTGLQTMVIHPHSSRLLSLTDRRTRPRRSRSPPARRRLRVRLPRNGGAHLEPGDEDARVMDRNDRETHRGDTVADEPNDGGQVTVSPPH